MPNTYLTDTQTMQAAANGLYREAKVEDGELRTFLYALADLLAELADDATMPARRARIHATAVARAYLTSTGDLWHER